MAHSLALAKVGTTVASASAPCANRICVGCIDVVAGVAAASAFANVLALEVLDTGMVKLPMLDFSKQQTNHHRETEKKSCHVGT